MAAAAWTASRVRDCVFTPSSSSANQHTTAGEISIVQGEPLEIRAKYVVCLAAPKLGLLRALESSLSDSPARGMSRSLSQMASSGLLTASSASDWSIWVVDLGLGFNRAWKKLSTGGKGARGVRFGPNWMVKLRFEDGVDLNGR